MRTVVMAAAALAAIPGTALSQGEPRAPATDATVETPPEDLLVTARTMYNEGRYDAAIETAKAAQSEHGSAATLTLGRAGLERYRTTADPADLGRAREALRSVDAMALAARDRIDLAIGLGEALFFDEHYQAAADIFDSLLEEAAELGPGRRDQLLDWWATAVDRHVRALPALQRADAIDRLIARLEDELRTDPTSGAAAYWLAAASFARGHVERAWNAAVAGWVRALLTTDRGAALRPDLDRLVRDAIIPERIRRLTAISAPESEQAQASMIAEWELVKERWTRR